MDFVFIDEFECLPEWLWPGHRVPGDMPIKHSAAKRARVFQRSCDMQCGPRSLLELCEAPVIGVNVLTVNVEQMQSMLEYYINQRMFSSLTQPKLSVATVVFIPEHENKVSCGDAFEIHLMPFEVNDEQTA